MADIEKQKRQVLGSKTTRIVDFPDDPKERFDALFSAIGNSEAKCTTLLVLERGPLTKHQIHTKYMESTEGVWKTSRSTQATYCDKTLVPIGLVTEADIIFDGVSETLVGFRLTEAGNLYGQPIAAHLLRSSSDLPYSLNELFGQTAKGVNQKRSVTSRVEILEALRAAQEPLRRVDISLATGVDNEGVGQHLRYLDTLGMVKYRSIGPEDVGYATYSLADNANSELLQKTLAYNRLSARVLETLAVRGSLSAPELASIIKDNYKWPERLSEQISWVLGKLTDSGLCKADLFIGGKTQSSAALTQNGERLLSEMVDPVKQALTDNSYLEDWRRINWSQYAPRGVERHKNSSSYANQQPIEVWVSQVHELLLENPGLRTKEIRDALGREAGAPLKVLLDQGRVRKEVNGHAVRYFLT